METGFMWGVASNISVLGMWDLVVPIELRWGGSITRDNIGPKILQFSCGRISEDLRAGRSASIHLSTEVSWHFSSELLLLVVLLSLQVLIWILLLLLLYILSH